MKKRLIATTLICGLLLPNLAYTASAAETTDTSRQAFMELFFQDAPELETNHTTSDLNETSAEEEPTIIHLPQVYPELIEATGEEEIVRETASTYVVGSTDTFAAAVTEGSTALTAATGTLKYQSTHTNVWLISQTGGSPDDLSSYYAAIATKTDAIYTLMTSELAAHENVLILAGYSNLPSLGDIGEDGRINVLLYDIYGDGATATSYTAGFFNPTDFFTDGNNLGSVVDAIHMDIGTIQGGNNLELGDGETFYGTIAHEFQHMLFYMYCGWKVSDSSGKLTWFNEALSGLTEMYYYTGTLNQAQSASDSKMTLANQNTYANGTSYGDFVNFNNSFKNYGMGNLFSIMMHKKTNGSYGGAIYDYFETIKNSQYSASDANTLVGNALKVALGDDFADYTGDEVFAYTYYAFMENYITDGGAVVTADGESYHTYSLWENNALWSEKDIAETGYAGYSTTYDTLDSGETFSLVGYPSDSSTIEASHEITLNLDADSDLTNTYLNITIGEADGLQAYVALYDSTAQTADLYPLVLGYTNGIDTKGKKAYLFASTLNADVENVTVTYNWTQEEEVPQGTVKTNYLTESGSELKLVVEFNLETYSVQKSEMFVGFYEGDKLVDIQIAEVILSGENEITLSKPTSYDSYKLFLADTQWDYVPLLTQVATGS